MIPTLFEPAYIFYPGIKPLLISMPHVGTHVPKEHRALFADDALGLPDTDWHLDRLYAFAKEMGAGILMARYSRFLIDLNRPADDAPLYPGATTGLFPETLFDGRPIYRQNVPDEWRHLYRRHLWESYHLRIRRELDYLKREFGYAILFDAHSIASNIPRLFEGELPHFNLGTNDGASCDQKLAEDIFTILRSDNRYHAVHNGRFKGGYITRHYGQPHGNIHALQLELAQRTYMKEGAPYSYDEGHAREVQPVLQKLVQRLIEGL